MAYRSRRMPVLTNKQNGAGKIHSVTMNAVSGLVPAAVASLTVPPSTNLFFDLEQNRAAPIRTTIGDVDVQAVGRFDPIQINLRAAGVDAGALQRAARVFQKIVPIARIADRAGQLLGKILVKISSHLVTSHRMDSNGRTVLTREGKVNYNVCPKSDQYS